MHIIIGVITAIAGLIWALNRLQNSGVNLNAFNPYFWFRRHQWEKQLGTKPIHRLERPMEAAAVLILGVVLEEGEISREQKADTISMFSSEFNLTSDAATELFSASAFMVRGTFEFVLEVKKILAPSMHKFSIENKTALLILLKKAGEFDGELTEHQLNIIGEVGRCLELSSSAEAH